MPGAVKRAVGWVAAIAGAVALAVLLAGPVHRGLEAVGIHGEFARTLRHLLLVLLLAVLAVGLKPWRDVPRDVYGLVGPDARPALWPLAAAVAILLLGAIAVGQAAAGWVTWDPGAGRKVSERWANALGKAAFLGFVEEAFFRGWLLARFRARWPVVRAALATAVVFGAVHSFRRTAAPKDLVPGPSGALEALSAWAQNLVDPADFLPRFVGLVLLSLLLTAVFLRTRTIWANWGLHGGAVLFLDAYSALTDRAPERNWAGSKWLYDGPPAWVAMAALAAFLWPKRARGGAPPPGVS